MSNIDDDEHKFNEYIARKSKFVNSREFEGNDKVLIFNSSKKKHNPNGKI